MEILQKEAYGEQNGNNVRGRWEKNISKRNSKGGGKRRRNRRQVKFKRKRLKKGKRQMKKIPKKDKGKKIMGERRIPTDEVKGKGIVKKIKV